MGKTDPITSFSEKVLFPSTKKALDYLSHQDWISNWYLAGGTALALQFGYRQSVDLDFFTSRKDFDIQVLIDTFQNTDWTTTSRENITVYGELFGAQISFIGYPQFMPQHPFHPYGIVQILDAYDIAVMKIMAVSQRGAKRDFYDLYWYSMNKEPLPEVLKRIPIQYPNRNHNFHHLLKSLTYFDDAEQDPDPVIFFDTTWQKVKEFFLMEVPKISREILELE